MLSRGPMTCYGIRKIILSYTTYRFGARTNDLLWYTTDNSVARGNGMLWHDRSFCGIRQIFLFCCADQTPVMVYGGSFIIMSYTTYHSVAWDNGMLWYDRSFCGIRQIIISHRPMSCYGICLATSVHIQCRYVAFLRASLYLLPRYPNYKLSLD